METILYPLILKSSFPAFTNTQKIIEIPFSLPNFLEQEYFKNNATIYYSLRRLSTNRSVLINSADSLECSVAQNEQGIWSASIPISNNIDGIWIQGEEYKFQLRYKVNDNGIETWSEWSTVCYLKATGSINLDISIPNMVEDKNNNTLYINSPIVYGIYKNTDNSEIEKNYKIDLLDNQNNIIESSGWKAHVDGEKDEYILSNILENLENYSIKYSVKTKNNYESYTTKSFITMLEILEKLEGIDIQSSVNEEEGYIRVHIKNNENNNKKIFGNIVLRRTDNKSNFNIWEDYQYYQLTNELVDIVFDDFLVESGVTYRYGIQLVSNEKYRSEMIYQDEFNEVTAYYNHAFLLGMDNDEQKQLKIKFNPKLSNLKRQLQETKIETIGSKFPFITRNGNVDYFSFSIGGLISYLADEQELFLNNRNKRFYGKDEEETYETDNSKNRFFFTNEINPSHTNIASERFFRELVEQFLTNGNYKIFKSPTEGVKIVSLLGVSLAPIETLGRMLYSFSSTANEVAEFNLNNAINYQIIQHKPFNTISNIITKMENGIYHVSQNTENIYNIIKNNLSQEQKFLKYLSSIQVEGNCTLTINSSINISVNEYFELKDIINITDLVVNTTSASAVTISYVAVYEEIITENEQLDLSLVAVSDFYQLTITSNWFIVNKEVDVFEKLGEELGVKIVNLKYTQIEVFQGQSPMIFYVNNSQKPLIIDGETSNILFDTKITDLKVVQDNYLAESVLATNTNADIVTNEEEVIYTTEPISIEDNEIKLGYITVIYVGLVKSNA